MKDLKNIELISNNKKISKNNPISLFLLIKLFSIILFLLFNLFIKIKHFRFVLQIILSFIEFFLDKNIFSFQLVGLQWEFSLNEDNFFTFFSRPPPFIPLSIPSNTFWIFLFFSIIFWFLIFIFQIFFKNFYLILNFFFSFFLNLLNLILFAKAHNLSKEKLENEALSSLIDDQINEI